MSPSSSDCRQSGSHHPLNVLAEQRCRHKAIHSGTYESVSDVRQPGGHHCEAPLRLEERRPITSSKKRSESGVTCASNRRNARTSSCMPFRSPHIAGGSRGSCPIRRATSPPTFNRSANASAAEFVGIRRWLIHSASRRDSRSSESRPYVELMLVTPIPPTRVPRTHSPRAFTRCCLARLSAQRSGHAGRTKVLSTQGRKPSNHNDARSCSLYPRFDGM